MKLAVMGCVVNGPGESKHANIGISLPGTFEEPKAPVFVDGRLLTTLKGDKIVAEFIEHPQRVRGVPLRGTQRSAGAGLAPRFTNGFVKGHAFKRGAQAAAEAVPLHLFFRIGISGHQASLSSVNAATSHTANTATFSDTRNAMLSISSLYFGPMIHLSLSSLLTWNAPCG